MWTTPTTDCCHLYRYRQFHSALLYLVASMRQQSWRLQFGEIEGDGGVNKKLWRRVKTFSFIFYWYPFKIGRLVQKVGRLRRKSRTDGRVTHTLSLSCHSARKGVSIRHFPLISTVLPLLHSSPTLLMKKPQTRFPASFFTFKCVCRVIPQINLTLIQLALNVSTAVKQMWCGFFNKKKRLILSSQSLSIILQDFHIFLS